MENKYQNTPFWTKTLYIHLVGESLCGVQPFSSTLHVAATRTHPQQIRKRNNAGITSFTCGPTDQQHNINVIRCLFRFRVSCFIVGWCCPYGYPIRHPPETRLYLKSSRSMDSLFCLVCRQEVVRTPSAGIRLTQAS